jgi:hypothetical protein
MHAVPYAWPRAVQDLQLVHTSGPVSETYRSVLPPDPLFGRRHRNMLDLGGLGSSQCAYLGTRPPGSKELKCSYPLLFRTFDGSCLHTAFRIWGTYLEQAGGKKPWQRRFHLSGGNRVPQGEVSFQPATQLWSYHVRQEVQGAVYIIGAESPPAKGLERKHWHS